MVSCLVFSETIYESQAMMERSSKINPLKISSRYTQKKNHAKTGRDVSPLSEFLNLTL